MRANVSLTSLRRKHSSVKTPPIHAIIMRLKPNQVACRIWRRVGEKTPLRPGYAPKPDPEKIDPSLVPTLPELDFDPVFLARFDADTLLNDRVELLQHEGYAGWRGS